MKDSQLKTLSVIDIYLNKMETKEHILGYLSIRERRFREIIETILNKNRDTDLE